MKKFRSIMAVVLAAAMLTGCEGKKTESGLEFSDSPFSNNNSDTTSEGQTGSYEELFGKYQTGSIRFGNYSIQGNSIVEYNGGDIELSFDMDTTGNQYDVEAGFMAFINGIPQKLSLNGGESGELVRVSQAPDKSGKATLSLTPTITEDLKNEKTLQLKIINIFNPSYKPSESYTGFGNAHLGQSFLELDIKAISPLAVSQDVFEPISDRGESILITDQVTTQYEIKKPDETTATTIFIHDAQTKETPLSLRDNKLDAEILMYGNEAYNYRIYVYVNHQRVKFNGGDYFEAETKNGYLNVFKPEIENINERDIIYAIAIPTNSDTGSMAVRKSGSVLVLDQNNISTDNSTPSTSVESQPETPSETSGSEQTVSEPNMDIYSYQTVGYIDDAQRYLLLVRPESRSNDPKYHDYILYDETANEVSGTLDGNIGEFYEMPITNSGTYTFSPDHPHEAPHATYGDGVVTADLQGYTDRQDASHPHYVVYNERFEIIKEVYDADISDIYGLTYSPSKKCWFFNKNEGFYTANEDFSEMSKIADFDLRKYFVLEDKIVYYRTVYNYSAPQNNADIFGIMELNGKVVRETNVAPYGAGEFRLVKAGDTICFMSELRFDTHDLLREPMDGIIFYDCKTGKQKTFYPEDDNENAFCTITPDGKKLVTGILDMENHYTINDITINVYDVANGKLLEIDNLGTSDKWFVGMSAYNDRMVLTNGMENVVYKYKSQ